ncbi:MAG: T9SS type A sorting domain-containing protein, partial [candidate division KSB1 bacterium]|nr:T9SS type A sorting domain-containing protein [candidate division KSB1 bacterium]
LASASEALPETFDLSQNYPNPFSAAGIKSETRISYQLPRASQVSLKIYNTLGQLIKTLVDQKKEAGFHTTFWDGRDEQGRMVASGIYFYQLKAKDFIQTRKMLWLR